MENCIFCKIINGEIPSNKVYEDDTVLAFRDIEPQAPKHILVIPKKHVKSLIELTDEDGQLVAHLFEVIRLIAKQEGMEENGFRTVINTGEDAYQTVKHLHIHMLAGRQFGWPPG